MTHETDTSDPLTLLDDPKVADLVPRLAEEDGPAEAAGQWPTQLWKSLETAQAHRWAILKQFGGEGLDNATLIRRATMIAEGSLTAAFIASQFNAATRRLVAASESGNEHAGHWLTEIANARAFPTIGTSQLTTSLRRGPRAMAAEPTEAGGYRFHGTMPWVTAAERASLFVTGGVLEDGRQVLVVLPSDRQGVSVGSRMPLTALQASCTAEVTCDNVQIEPDEVLFGPAPDVMSLAGKSGGSGSLETSALTIGQARAALKALRGLAPKRDDLAEPIDALEASWETLASMLLAAAEQRTDAPSASEIRAKANPFVLQSTQAYLTARKGSGFLLTEPAQRWARQALFFLVWSCPGPVAQSAIRDFAGLCHV